VHGSLRRLALVALVAAVGICAGGAGAAGAPARSIASADALEPAILVELNAIRREHGLVPLRLSTALTQAADTHSRAMGTFGFFTHESRDGSVFWKRVQRFYAPRDAATWSVGENLLWSAPTIEPKAAVALWMKSPGHRKNILTARWREIGLSAVAVTAAPGVFGGRDVTIVTSEFGVR
jgi:uncharacterized protein YkwD